MADLIVICVIRDHRSRYTYEHDYTNAMTHTFIKFVDADIQQT